MKKLCPSGDEIRTCGDCGRAFSGKTVKSKKKSRVEYWCSTYLHYGKEHCGSHAIREEYLDEIIRTELIATNVTPPPG